MAGKKQLDEDVNDCALPSPAVCMACGYGPTTEECTIFMKGCDLQAKKKEVVRRRWGKALPTNNSGTPEAERVAEPAATEHIKDRARGDRPRILPPNQRMHVRTAQGLAPGDRGVATAVPHVGRVEATGLPNSQNLRSMGQLVLEGWRLVWTNPDRLRTFKPDGTEVPLVVRDSVPMVPSPASSSGTANAGAMSAKALRAGIVLVMAGKKDAAEAATTEKRGLGAGPALRRGGRQHLRGEGKVGQDPDSEN